MQPKIVQAAGTSWLHGIANEQTTNKHWNCPFTIAQSLFFKFIPQQQHGHKHGAPILQHISMLQQHTPAYKSDKHHRDFVNLPKKTTKNGKQTK